MWKITNVWGQREVVLLYLPERQVPIAWGESIYISPDELDERSIKAMKVLAEKGRLALEELTPDEYEAYLIKAQKRFERDMRKSARKKLLLKGELQQPAKSKSAPEDTYTVASFELETVSEGVFEESVSEED
jgi:hypothetical protein